jgi:pimeloyl-ACP methyl ester carboxylesterase
MNKYSVLVLSLLILSAAAGRAVPHRLTLGACTDPALPKDARCGTYKVFENRAARKGRKIPLRVVVLPALGPDRLPDPVVYFQGGPGFSSVVGGLEASQLLAPLRQRRDFLLVDFRGIAGSAGLDCPELHGLGIQEILDNGVPLPKVRACRERLSRTADLTQYTTGNAVDDVDEVRAALGYPQVNLMGGSYGSRAVLVYLRRHPGSVRTAILEGVSTTHIRTPLFFPRDGQRALDGLVAECASDAGCARAFPHLADEISEVLARAGRKPVPVRLRDVKTGKPYEIRLSRAGVGSILRNLLYTPAEAAELPLRVHLAAQGNWSPLAEAAGALASSVASRSDGYFLSVLCAEDVAFIRDQDIPAAVAGTFQGDLRIRQYRAACTEWTAAKLPESFTDPVVSDIPALLVNGERDPATPASGAEEAARTLSHHRYILVPKSGHSLEGMKGRECIQGLSIQTVEDGSVDRLDTSCVVRMERPPFVFSEGEPEVAVGRADLEALVGSYAGSGEAMEIDLLEGRLRLKIESKAFFLLPTALTRFRPEGLPAGYAVVFERADGRPATAVTLIQPGQPDERLTRKP